MNRFEYKQKMRKILWVTQKETGKRKTKKMINEAANMVRAMETKPKENWRGESKPESIADLVNQWLT
jgi:hypothetical protein